MKKIMMFIIAFFAVFALTSCAPADIALNPMTKAAIHKVSVKPEIKVDNTASYSGSSTTRAISNQGALGCAIAMMVVAPTENKIEKIMNARENKLEQVFYQDFIKALQSQSGFKYANTADAQFKLELLNYGFSDKPGFSGKTLPYVNARAELYDPQNQVVWRSTKQVYLNQEAYSQYSVDDYVKNADLMNKAFDALIAQVSEELVAGLNY